MILKKIEAKYLIHSKHKVSKETLDFYTEKYTLFNEHIRSHKTSDDGYFLTVIMRTQGKKLDTIKEALESLVNQTNQHFKTILLPHNVSEELLNKIKDICDSLPKAFLKNLKIVPINEGNRTYPLNRGFELCETDYAAILDDDDIAYDNWVENFYSIYRDNYGKLLHQYVIAQDYNYEPNNCTPCGPIIYKYCNLFNINIQRKVNYCPLMSIAFPTYLNKSLDFKFDETLDTAEDWNYINRCSYLCGVADSQNIGAIYRLWVNADNSYKVHSKKVWMNNYIKSLKLFRKIPVIYSFKDDQFSNTEVRLLIDKPNKEIYHFSKILGEDNFAIQFDLPNELNIGGFRIDFDYRNLRSIKLNDIILSSNDGSILSKEKICIEPRGAKCKNGKNYFYKINPRFQFSLSTKTNVKTIFVTYSNSEIKCFFLKKLFYKLLFKGRNIAFKILKGHRNHSYKGVSLTENEFLVLKKNKNCNKDITLSLIQQKRLLDKHILEVNNQITKPFLSIITRTQGNRKEMLEELLLVLSSQSSRNFELIIVPHKVSNEKLELIKSQVENTPLWLQHQTSILPLNTGNRTTPINFGISNSKGMYFVVLDDDDIVFEDYVKNFENLAKVNYGKVLHQYAVGQDWKLYSSSSTNQTLRSISAYDNDFALDFCYKNQRVLNICPPLSIAFPTYCYKKMGFIFDESLDTTEDWDYINRLVFFAGVADSDNIGAIYRLWQNGDNSHATETKKTWHKNYRKIKRRNKKLPIMDLDALNANKFLYPYSVMLFLSNGRPFKDNELVETLKPRKHGDDLVSVEFKNLSSRGPITYVRLDPDFVGGRKVENFSFSLFDTNNEIIKSNEYKIETNGITSDFINYEFPIDDPQIHIIFKNKTTLNSVKFSYYLLKSKKRRRKDPRFKSPLEFIKWIWWLLNRHKEKNEH